MYSHTSRRTDVVRHLVQREGQKEAKRMEQLGERAKRRLEVERERGEERAEGTNTRESNQQICI